MVSLLALTENFIKLERSKLNADVSAGSNVTLKLENNKGFADNYYVVIGNEGAEKCELEQIDNTVSGSTDIRVATLRFNHKKGEPIVRYLFNQRKFYGSVTETGTYTELAADGSPKTIEVDDPQGSRLEYTGEDGYLYFKATYYNSELGKETLKADAKIILPDESTYYCSLFAIRKQAGLTENSYISDGDIEVYRKRAENEVKSTIVKRYTLPLSVIPAIIENATVLLGAGYIDYKEFGGEGEGVKWLGEARGLLKSIRKGTQILLDSDGNELNRKTTGNNLAGFPDDSIEEGASDDVMYKIDDKY